MTGRDAGTVARRLGTLLVLAVVAGLLVAGLTLPFVGGVGLLAKKGNQALDKLPSDLVAGPLAQHSVLLASDGSVIATLAGPEDRVIVPADAIPPVMQKAIVAIEDNRFYEHNGVDLRGLLRAASADTSSGDYAQGASTITEQYVKLVEQEDATSAEAKAAATEKSLNRKLTDARLAIALEKKLSKQQILTDYLNIAYFGEGVYGVGTAAEHFFGIPVQDLSLAQAALLAGLVNDPYDDDPVLFPKNALVRRNQVLDAVSRYQLLPAAQITAAEKTKIIVHITAKATNPCLVSSAPVFCQYALNQLLADPKLGTTQAARNAAVYEGGLKIYTTYSPAIQKSVDAGIAAHLPDTIRQVDASVVEQPGTGAILAIGQNRAYGIGPGKSETVFATQENHNVGSTFKLMTLTTALEQGISPDTRIASPACFTSKTLLPEYFGKGKKSCPNGVSNAGDSESCDCDMYSGTWSSVNTFYVQLELKVGGPQVVAQTAKALGVVGGPTFQNGKGIGPSLTLGSGGGFSAIDMATAYATIDAHGLTCTPNAVAKITTLSGRAVPFTGSNCHQAVSADIADKVTSILQGVLNKPGATGANGLSIGREAAAKTGTVDDSAEAWFVGYIPQFVTAVGVFDPLKIGSPATPITDLTGRTYTGGSLYGATIPGGTWHTIMKLATQGLPYLDFNLPEASDFTDTSTPISPTPTPGATTSGSPTAAPTSPAPGPTAPVTPTTPAVSTPPTSSPPKK